MTLRCVWEHNGADTLLHPVDFPGACARGESLEAAKAKLATEIRRYAVWLDGEPVTVEDIAILQDAPCTLAVRDADSDVLLPGEEAPLTREDYERLKTAVLRSAADFLVLYQAVTDKARPLAPARESFYGPVPTTAEAMYTHTKSVNAYYFGEIGVGADNEGDILSCRRRGFEALERQPDFLARPPVEGSYGEWWSLRKVLRRFLWHDRIHARALYRRGSALWPLPDVFGFACR